jgi:hypothetical protein
MKRIMLNNCSAVSSPPTLLTGFTGVPDKCHQGSGKEEFNLPLLFVSSWAACELAFDQSHVCVKGIKGLARALLNNVVGVSRLETADDRVANVILDKGFELSSQPCMQRLAHCSVQ